MKINFPFKNNFDADFLLILIVFGDQQQVVLKTKLTDFVCLLF